MRDRNREPRLQVITGSGGSKSDPRFFRLGRARIRTSRPLVFTSEELTDSLWSLPRPTDRFPGGDAA
jgi:hypothetical protein